MNPEIKQKWVEALRSGKYSQTRGTLKNQDANGCPRFCCLGVLCDISEGHWYDLGPVITFTHKDDRAGGYLPVSLRQTANLSPRQEGVLTDMNDSGKSFSEIADYIEQNL